MESSPNCRLCHSLEHGEIEELPFDEWVEAICTSKCPGCQMIVSAARQLQPEILSKRHDSNFRIRLRFSKCCGFHAAIIASGKEGQVADRKMLVQFFYPAAKKLSAKPYPVIAEAPEISPFPGHSDMWRFLQKSLQLCLSEHQKCRENQNPRWYPDRLLALKRKSENDLSIKIIETKDTRPKSPYIALSHCWGSDPFIRTTKENIASHLAEVSKLDLPRTFQDVLTVAEKLGVFYVWIDSLCIVQDCKQDWAEHSEIMGEVYRNALFVVAAVSSSAASEPFLYGDAPNNRSKFKGVNVTPNTSHIADGNNTEILARPYHSRLLPHSISGPLESRAWAWQERYCAIRVIDFMEEEVKWHCKSASVCECQDQMQKPYDFANWARPDMDKLELFHCWQTLVSTYSGRDLTYSTDRLPALAGVASQFSTLYKSNYVAGLWESEFPQCLAWYRKHADHIDKALDNDVPSWSWASIASASEWQWGGVEPHEKILSFNSKVQITAINCKPSTANLYGQVQKGSYIELCGKISEATLVCNGDGAAWVIREGLRSEYVRIDCNVESFLDHNAGSNKTHMKRVFPRKSFDEEDITTHTASTPEGSIQPATLCGIQQGTVYCLLLLTTNWSEYEEAYILLLGKDPQQDNGFRRLGMWGCSTLWATTANIKLFREWSKITNVECSELGDRGDWEEWFKDAEMRKIKIF